MKVLLSRVPLFVIPWTVARPAGSSVHGILQARILERPSSGDFPNPGMEPGSQYYKQLLYHLSHQGSPINTRNLCFLLFKQYNILIYLCLILYPSLRNIRSW